MTGIPMAVPLLIITDELVDWRFKLPESQPNHKSPNQCVWQSNWHQVLDSLPTVIRSHWLLFPKLFSSFFYHHLSYLSQSSCISGLETIF